jgi:hypothetical protein
MNERLPLATRSTIGNLTRAYKATGCVECGVRYPEVDWSELHADHIDPRTKSRSAHSSITESQGGGSLARFHSGTIAELLAEMLLCQVLCFQCHKAKTRAEYGGSYQIEGQLPLFNGSGGWRY